MLECAHVRRRSSRPFILDEVLTGAREIVEAHAAGALDAVRLKFSNVGGITPTRRARDVAVALGLPLTIEDAGGGDIVTAASMHVACSTDSKLMLGDRGAGKLLDSSFALMLMMKQRNVFEA